MTIAISLKVNDGIVLAADSAATIYARSPDQKTSGVANLYYNAEKVFNLYKGYPVGLITWGSGSIGSSSISTLVRDFRKKISLEQNDKREYIIKDIAEKFVDFMIKDHYETEFSSWNQKPELGFIVAGYSTDQDYPEEWILQIHNGQYEDIKLLRNPKETGIIWSGQPEAITRLYLGYGTGLYQLLIKILGNEDNAKILKDQIERELTIPLVIPPLPIQDAIDLVEFLVSTTISFSKFAPGPNTVGGPIDIAAITKHEGFKWVKRKLYYERSLNPTL